MSTLFDPAAFLDMPVDAPLEKRPPLPQQDYIATIQEVTAGQWQSKDKFNPDGSNKSGVKYDVKLTLEIPGEVQTQLGIEMPTMQMTDGIMLELNDAGGIDTGIGKNRQLRNYREALDMNKAGESFRASAMVGRVLRVRIKHEIYPAGTDNIVEKIAGVSKA